MVRRSLVGSHPPVTHGPVPDPARQRLLFVSFTARDESPLNGLWSLDPKGGEFKRYYEQQYGSRL